MEFNAQRVDSANAVVTSTISGDVVAKNLDRLAKQASKSLDIQGFRKGKVPVSVVKQRYGDKLQQDAEGDSFREVYSKALEQLEVNVQDVIGEPGITKYDKKDDGSIEIEMKIAIRPEIDLGDYKALLPTVEAKEAEDAEIEEKLTQMAKNSAPLTALAEPKAVENGDFAVIDFEGFLDGEPFAGGKAEAYPLEVGSGSFIPGFEEQVIGMNYDETKDINVTFPAEYQAADLAGKEVVFKVRLVEIQEKKAGELDDELAKKMLPSEPEATLDSLKEKIKEQIVTEKKVKYYNEELRPAYLDKLVEEIEFALPESVVEQEINQVLNAKVRTMSEEEFKALQDDAAKIEELRAEVKPEASNSVKATFIVDALAKAEEVTVTDQEVTQVLYYEALQTGQNPQDVIKQYEQAGYLPAIKMSMIEDRVITKLLDGQLEK